LNLDENEVNFDGALLDPSANPNLNSRNLGDLKTRSVKIKILFLVFGTENFF